MKIIGLIAVLSMVALNVFGTKSSVGGPLTELFASVLIMLAVGIHFAWSRKFGVLGWSLCIVAALAGGIVGIVVLGTSMDTILDLSHFQGRLIDTNWIYVASAIMALVSVVAAWVPLELGSRLIAWRRQEV